MLHESTEKCMLNRQWCYLTLLETETLRCFVHLGCFVEPFGNISKVFFSQIRVVQCKRLIVCKPQVKGDLCVWMRLKQWVYCVLGPICNNILPLLYLDSSVECLKTTCHDTIFSEKHSLCLTKSIKYSW